jgi:dihydrofolate reductase
MNKPKISAIVAMDEKRGIGKNNSIPWRIPGEQKMFKEITMPHPMIMGRKTFESLGRILPGRPHIVITRDAGYKVDGVTVVNSLEEALRQAQDEQNSEEVFIIGGGQIFREALEKDLVDRLYLTVVKGDYGADVFFPDYSEFTKKNKEEDREVENYKYKFLILEK